MTNIVINYGNDEGDFVAVIHPRNISIQKIVVFESMRNSLYGWYNVSDSSVSAVAEVFEDFLLNTHKHLPSHHNFFGLRNLAREEFGSDIDPLSRIPPEDPTMGELLYPGLFRFPLEKGFIYTIEKMGHIPIMSYLPYEFSHIAQQL